ncbi:branched-subunit amino acid transport system permease [Aliiruegeria haliotis]|uniref:Branched-subunit amino acid transport system permease n=1 Tax=Aliiruegeria haliotis TaxID=1280846 RepID=A0A2T0RMY1_9RHOB|nr:hypothetical protein [Aliiruegeria haliotis]PRY22482.1 branched-subunit amino acid transport system permease [Aliiruegeria haliotis]
MSRDAGAVYFDGSEVQIASPSDAKDIGIETVYQDLTRFPESYQMLGSGYVMPISIMFGAALLIGLFLTRTQFGNHAYAIGGNEEVARLSGVDVARSRIKYYMIGGLMAGIAAILEVSKLNFAQSSRGQSYELFAIGLIIILAVWWDVWQRGTR